MNTKMKTLLLTLVSLGLSSVGAFGQQPIIENNGVRVPAKEAAAVNKPPQPASLRLADTIERGRNLFSLDEVSAAQFAAADEQYAKTRPNRGLQPPQVGIVRAVGQTFGPDSFVNVASGSTGERKVWAMAVRSTGAHYLRLRFVNFDASDASVIVYARNGDEVVTLGPFTGKGPQRSGDFWTLSLPGDTAFIEFSGSGEPRLEIAEVMHYDKLPAPTAQKRSQGLSQAQPPGEHPCFLDVMADSKTTITSLR